MKTRIAILALLILALAACGGSSASSHAAAPHPSIVLFTDPNGTVCQSPSVTSQEHTNWNGVCPTPTPTSQQAATFTDPAGQTCAAADEDNAGYCPGDDPSPTLVPVTKVEFVVSGYAPNAGCGSSCGPTVDYGSNSDTHDVQLSSLNGTVTYSMPFDPDAQFYSLNAQLSGGGHVTCKIVAIGPSPDVPTTVSHGSASGGSAICSAQAAPDDPGGSSWTNEQ